VASEEHRFLVSDALDAAHLTLNASSNSTLNFGGSKAARTVLFEPVGRNTAAAMAIAALAVKANAGPQDLLLFCPADHHIPDAAAFALVVKQGVAAAQAGAIVTFGISPTFPSTAYGYIRQGSARADGAFQVDGFTEKPALDKAQALLLSGKALWNGGIFLTTAQTLLAALQTHAPDILKSCTDAMAQAATGGWGCSSVGRGCSCTDVVGSSWLARLLMALSWEAEVYERSEVEAGSLRCSVVCVLFISSQAKPPHAMHAFAVESSPRPSLMADTRRAL
jgi:mannose-1-phosphate guanylyltransferase